MPGIGAVLELAGYRRDPGLWGPQRSGPCPCGSALPAQDCHSSDNGQWLEAAAPPLLAGHRTGISNPICYARSSKDCSQESSKEHWISRNILRSMSSNGKPPMLEGLPWLQGQRRPIPAGALDSRILCKRHNNALSVLDGCAGRVFRALHLFQDELVPGAKRSPDRFLLVSGQLFERWLLKLALGGLFSGSFTVPGEGLDRLAQHVALENLVDVLFRGAAWPPDWGFYALPQSVDPTAIRVGIAIQPRAMPTGGLAALTVEIGVVRLDLLFGKAGQMLGYQPGALALYASGKGTEKLVAFAWPTNGHEPITYARHD